MNTQEPVELPRIQAPFLAAMALAGALLGPCLDGFHSRFGVLHYINPPPFPVEVGGLELCQTAIWVPPLFGLAGVIIGVLYILLDAYLQSPSDSRSPGLSVVLVGIICFVLQYFASGVLLGTLGPLADWSRVGQMGPFSLNFAEAALWGAALLHWRVFDGTVAGFLVSLMTAIGGPLIEIGLLNAPGAELYEYFKPDVLGIPTWIAPVYFCGGPAVGNLARFVFASQGSRTDA